MSRISWGTMRKLLREAEIALGSPNQVLATQKLRKAVGYIHAANARVSKEPGRYSPADAEMLGQVVGCLKSAQLRTRDRKEDLSAYLSQGLLAVRALQGVTMPPQGTAG